MAGELNSRGRPFQGGPQQGALRTGGAGIVSAFTSQPQDTGSVDVLRDTFRGLGQFSEELNGLASNMEQRQELVKKTEEESAANQYLATAKFEEVGEAIRSGDINVMGGAYYRALILARHGEGQGLRTKAEILNDYAKKSEIDPNYDPTAKIEELRQRDISMFGENDMLTSAYQQTMDGLDAQLIMKRDENMLKEQSRQNNLAAFSQQAAVFNAGIAAGEPIDSIIASLDQTDKDSNALFGVSEDDLRKNRLNLVAAQALEGKRDVVNAILDHKPEGGFSIRELMPDEATRLTDYTKSKWNETTLKQMAAEIDPVMASITTEIGKEIPGSIDTQIEQLRSINKKYTEMGAETGPIEERIAMLQVRRDNAWQTGIDRAEAKARAARAEAQAEDMIQQQQSRVETAIAEGSISYSLKGDELAYAEDVVAGAAYQAIKQGKWKDFVVTHGVNLNSSGVRSRIGTYLSSLLLPVQQAGGMNTEGLAAGLKSFADINNYSPALAKDMLKEDYEIYAIGTEILRVQGSKGADMAYNAMLKAKENQARNVRFEIDPGAQLPNGKRADSLDKPMLMQEQRYRARQPSGDQASMFRRNYETAIMYGGMSRSKALEYAKKAADTSFVSVGGRIVEKKYVAPKAVRSEMKLIPVDRIKPGSGIPRNYEPGLAVLRANPNAYLTSGPRDYATQAAGHKRNPRVWADPNRSNHTHGKGKNASAIDIRGTDWNQKRWQTELAKQGYGIRDFKADYKDGHTHFSVYKLPRPGQANSVDTAAQKAAAGKPKVDQLRRDLADEDTRDANMMARGMISGQAYQANKAKRAARLKALQDSLK